MVESFKVEDIVRFSLKEEDVYSFEVPKYGTLGLIEIQTHSIGLEKALGVIIPMSIVQWEDGQKSAVFTHDIEKVVLPEDQEQLLKNKIKSIMPYTGPNIN